MLTGRQTLYDRDFQVWLEETLEKLRRGEFDSVDWENVLEELADLGKNNRRAIESLLTRLLEHLLKLAYGQGERESHQRGWKGEIRTFRKQIRKRVEDSPSLRPYLESIFEDCYRDAREVILDVTGFGEGMIPEEVIASLDEVLDENWFPDGV